jgi:amino acid adenylation domain-containing protein
MPGGDDVRVLPDLLRRIWEHAAQRPDHPAVTDSRTSLTYAALLDRAAVAARALTHRGVRPGDRIGLHLENSSDYVVAVLACLRIGAIFVPVPFSDPQDRVRRIAGDCAVLLTVVAAHKQLSEAAARALRAVPLDELYAEPPGPAGVTGRSGSAARSHRDIVYCVYTSGSTGTPKGVLIRWESLDNFVRNTIATFGLDRDTRALCVSPFHFDGSFGSLFSVLAAGGSLVVAGHGPVLPGEFFRLLSAERITHTSFSPSLLRLIVASRDLPRLKDSHLRTIGLGGEDCVAEDIAALLRHRPQLRVFNRYGPTETTVVVASHLVTAAWCAGGRKIPLGRPDPDVSFHLVDADGRIITEAGTVGELYVGGVQVMAGYWGAPEATAAVLRDDVVPGSTVYRTGDLVQRTDDGLYVYLDRADSVVKRAGNRISTTEITAALLEVPGVDDAVSIVDRPNGRTVIRSFVATGLPLTAASVRTELLRRVPAYMNPDTVTILAALPRMSGGKPDLKRLRNHWASIGRRTGSAAD